MRDDTEGGVSQEIRDALLEQSDLTISEIYARCTLASSTNAVASLMHTECAAERATRTGERGAYRYKLTELGVAVAKNPRLLKSRHARRRGPGAPKPQIPAAVVRNLSGGLEPKPSPAASDIPLPQLGAHSVAQPGGEKSADLNFRDPNLRLAGAVLVHWPRGHAIPVSLSDLILETIDRARFA